MAKRVPRVIFLIFIFVAASVCGQALGQNLVDATVKSMKWPDYEGAQTSTINILKNTSQVLRFDRPIVRVAVSNMAICDVTMVGEKDILMFAKSAGNANLLVWDANDFISTYYLESTLDINKLHGMLQDIDPNANLKIVPFNDTAAVYGTTETSLKLKQIQEASKAFDKNVISYVRLRESKQVLLEVRFAEVNRKANKDFHLDVQAITRWMAISSFTGQTGASLGGADSFTPLDGANTYTALPPATGTETIGNVISTYVNKRFRLSEYLKYLEQKNILKLIARPNLVAKDGEEASFVVGGEFPVPTVSTNGVQINYKEFGTKLKFTPEILDGEVIRLKTESEVSELDFSSTVTSGGTTVPSILKRNSQTVSELHDNDSLVIGGLITQKINRVIRKVPLVGDIPVLNMFFKSNEFSRTDVELLIVITPHIVRPFQTDEKKEFYDPQEVMSATRPFLSTYKDAQGDAINHLMSQQEVYRDFNVEEISRFSKSVAQHLDQKKIPAAVVAPIEKTPFIVDAPVNRTPIVAEPAIKNISTVVVTPIKKVPVAIDTSIKKTPPVDANVPLKKKRRIGHTSIKHNPAQNFTHR
ncbi:MAG: hypothetical protein AUJ72_03730 [Candidatus Omnitrophica bacterium CG1_02_46_14]|nr:MAG: hypothetical protein AUJ72_03730 [Candidatus Omnitrophica bacterium CG1_02_46_14]